MLERGSSLLGLQNLSEYTFTGNEPFFIVLGRLTDFRNEKEGIDGIEIVIPKDPKIAYDGASRRIIESEYVKPNWRWPAGGLVIILELRQGQKILLALHRDKGAPSYHNHDTIGSGLGHSQREILFPIETAFCEGMEEMVITVPDRLDKVKVVYPDIEIDCEINLESIARDRSKLWLENPHLIGVKAELLKLSQEKEFRVTWDGTTKSFTALLILDGKTRGIDVVKIVKMKLDCTLDDLTVFDGEQVGGKRLDRVVHAYELDSSSLIPTGYIIASWQYGTKSILPRGKYPYKLTPLLEDIIYMLSNQPKSGS